jgi:hypothetical protein
MAKRLVEGSKEIHDAIRALGLDPNEVHSLTVTIEPGLSPIVHVTLMPDHVRAAAVLAAMKSVDYGVQIDQHTDVRAEVGMEDDVPPPPSRCKAKTYLQETLYRCELAPHNINRLHQVHPDGGDRMVYRW